MAAREFLTLLAKFTPAPAAAAALLQNFTQSS
jgi:hypothetical protein